MNKLIFAALLAAAGAATAAPEVPSAYRLYKLCDMQDPQCMPVLRSLHAQVVAARPVCKQYPMNDRQLYMNFMQVVSRDESILRYPALTVERYALSTALPCF